MSDTAAEPPPLDLRAWVAEMQGTPTTHAQRQIIAIILNAVAMVDAFRGSLVLKGGTLMAIAHGSRRQTIDLDFTARGAPEHFAQTFVTEMNRGLDRARARLGYAQWRCRVQGTPRRKPRPQNFATADGPALEARIAYARTGSRDITHLEAGTCTHVIPIEVSFREPLIDTIDARLLAGGPILQVYSVNELLAEKFRAYLQQALRDRVRRQDIYDIAFLLEAHGETGIDRQLVMRALVEKCRARGVVLAPDGLDDPELQRRAKLEWPQIALEIGELPSFDSCFAIARRFWRSLPWLLDGP